MMGVYVCIEFEKITYQWSIIIPLNVALENGPRGNSVPIVCTYKYINENAHKQNSWLAKHRTEYAGKKGEKNRLFRAPINAN